MQEFISKAAICSNCKNPQGTLELYQNDRARAGLKETLFSECKLCKNIVHMSTSKLSNDRFAEINVRSVQADINSGNGLNDLEKLCSQLNLPSPVTSLSYNNIIKSIRVIAVNEAEASMKEASKFLRVHGR